MIKKFLKVCKKNKRCIITVALTTLIGILTIALFRNILVFLGFLVVNAFLNYYQGRMEFQFDLTPSLVLVIIFSIKLGLGYGLLFLFLGSVIPSVIAAGFNHMTFLFVGLAMFIAYLGSLGITDNFLLYGLGLIVIQSVFGYFIARFFSGEPMTVFSVYLGFFLNIFYFLILNGVILRILV